MVFVRMGMSMGLGVDVLFLLLFGRNKDLEILLIHFEKK